MIPEELTKLTVGAILHDIGKLKQRVGLEEDKGKTHSLIGYEWLKDHYGEGLIAAAARNHHGSVAETWESNFTLILYEADNLAASERKSFDSRIDIDQEWHREVHLACDFLKIRLPDEQATCPPSPKYWPLSPMGGWVTPVDQEKSTSKEAYRNLWESFNNEFKTVLSAGNHLNIRVLLHLMEKYTAYVPSITLQLKAAEDEDSFRRHPDVSLFDHSRVTAAAAVALYHYVRSQAGPRWEIHILKEEILEDWSDSTAEPFLLIGGDLSGIQNFIYTISSKGALKSLKGRSFFLELFIEYVVERLLGELQLPYSNVIFSGGGHFYILGPNTKDALRALRKIKTEINEYLFQTFNGTLMQLLEWVPMGKGAFKGAAQVWAKLSEKLESAKRRKWEDRLDQILSPPCMPHPDCLTESCEVCWREDAPLLGSDPRTCPSCRQQFLFGQSLQKVFRETQKKREILPAITVWDNRPDSEEFLEIGAGEHTWYCLPVCIQKGKENPYRDAAFVYWINQWDLQLYSRSGDRPLKAGIYHPSDFEDLETLVDSGFGLERAAVLRMDVDRLGQIFSRGLPEGDRTFSRIASLSRNLSLFFQYHLNGVLNPHGLGEYTSIHQTDSAGRIGPNNSLKRSLTIVYSGGDDLFLIGHWLDVLEAAYDIREAFQKYTGGTTITISGGYAIGDSHHPVCRFGKDSEKALIKAKSNGRNSLSLQDRHVFPWDEAVKIRDLVRDVFLPLLEKKGSVLAVSAGSVSKGFFYRLLALVKDTQGAWVLPKVAYLAGRNAPSRQWLEANRRAAKAWSELKSQLFKMPDPRHLEKIKCATAWTIMMMRKGGKG
jgi:CRISPR-associated protein Csm1